MTRKRKTDQTKVFLDAALHVAARKGWDKTSLSDISARAKIRDIPFKNKTDVLKALLNRLDQDMLALAGQDLDASPRDRLFEVLMARFDVLSENKRAWISILKTAGRHPRMASALLPSLHHSMRTIAKAANCKVALAPMIGILYFSVVCVWKNDESQDMSKTMAALDQRLEKLDFIAARFPLTA